MEDIFTVRENIHVTENVCRMTVTGAGAAGHRPGQFINIKLPGCFLRRPISVCDAGSDYITLYYKTVGTGTDIMSRMAPGDEINALTHLGNGFDLNVREGKGSVSPLLVGGGVGCPPLYFLAKELTSAGVQPKVLIGFNSPAEVILENEFKQLEVSTQTVTSGFVTDSDMFTHGDYDYIYTCGPLPMLKAVYDKSTCKGQYSFEERMGCGFGACMGCSVKTNSGYKRICKDGPVLLKEDIIWPV